MEAEGLNRHSQCYDLGNTVAEIKAGVGLTIKSR